MNTSVMVGSSHKKRVGSAHYPAVSKSQAQPLQTIYGQIADANHIEAAQNLPHRAQPKIIEQRRPYEAKSISKSSYIPASTSNDAQHPLESSSMGAMKPMQVQEKKKIKLLSVSATGQGLKRPHADEHAR